ncbi:transcription factor bHLH162-like [Silene latifolia]|uniref:transcription factor bHLH162-like n=1 Tax=Silene latifolia TaxID=37657 RepID=UPI003D780735
MDKSSSSSRKDRKTIEKNRRNQMKDLYSQLNSLVPQDASRSRDGMPLPDQIDEATNYITQLHGNVENLRQQRDSLRGGGSGSGSGGSGSGSGSSRGRRTGLSNSPVQVQINETGGALEIILVTGLECQFVFTEAMRILSEENVDVIDANYSVVESTVFHTIHAQVGEAASRNAVARVTERLQRFAL